MRPFQGDASRAAPDDCARSGCLHRVPISRSAFIGCKHRRPISSSFSPRTAAPAPSVGFTDHPISRSKSSRRPIGSANSCKSATSTHASACRRVESSIPKKRRSMSLPFRTRPTTRPVSKSATSPDHRSRSLGSRSPFLASLRLNPPTIEAGCGEPVGRLRPGGLRVFPRSRR